MNDLRHVKVEGKTVFRTHGDRLEFFIVMMCFGACGPVENDIRCWHEFHVHHPRIDRMLAWIKRRDPHTFVTRIYEIAMLEFKSANVNMRLAEIRDDDADVANWDLHHRHLFDLDKPRI